MSYNVEAWVDGSVYPRNPGTISSGAAILINKSPFRIGVCSLTDYTKPGTNNKGEILAIIAAIDSMKPNRQGTLTIYSDSMYALEGFKKVDASGKYYKTNTYLWEMLKESLAKRPLIKIFTRHVKGHTGIQFNELAHDAAYLSANAGMQIPLTKFKSLEELNDFLKEEQRRVKEDSGLQGRATKAGFYKR